MSQLGARVGVCAVCRLPVHENEAGNTNQLGGYVHAKCVERAVGPLVVQRPELNDVRGICDVCRMPVFVDQARSKNQRGAYVHAQCVSQCVSNLQTDRPVPDGLSPSVKMVDSDAHEAWVVVRASRRLKIEFDRHQEEIKKSRGIRKGYISQYIFSGYTFFLAFLRKIQEV
jgi:hypothetical protein